MGKIPKKKSKRLLVKDKHKITRKVAQHHKKQRREAKKNPNKFKHKDPGIPNSWPFKQELLAEMESARADERAEHERARLHKEKLRTRALALKTAKAQKAAPSAKEVRHTVGVSTLSSADVLVLCVDARDPPAGRCAQLEERFARARGPSSVVVVLTHAHLVPAENLGRWLRASAASGVQVAPFSAVPEAGGGSTAPKRSNRQQPLRAVGVTELCELLSRIALADGARASELKVAVAGPPGSGAAELLRCLQLRLRKKGPARGHVSTLDEHVVLEPRLAPEGGLPAGNPTSGVLTFGIRPSRKATDLVALAAALLDRCADHASLMRYYSLPAFNSAADFLLLLARLLQLPAAEGSVEPDPALAALAFLEQWRLGRVPYCSRPPPEPTPAESAAKGGTAFAAEVYTAQVMQELAEALAQTAAAAEGAAAAGAHLVLTPSQVGFESEIVAGLEQIGKAARRARGSARPQGAAEGSEEMRD